jgi:hypothetical protein
MENSITISGSTYTVRGTVRDQKTNEGVLGLNVVIYDKDILKKDDFLGIGVTNVNGQFEVSFKSSAFSFFIFDRKPDLYFVIDDGGTVLLNTENNVIKNANASTPPINLLVDMSKSKLRALINPVPVSGWVGGFAQSNPEFAYPTPNLSSLEIYGNMQNLEKL